MLTINKVKKGLTKICGFKDVFFIANNKNIIAYYKILGKNYHSLQNIKPRNENVPVIREKQALMYDAIIGMKKYILKIAY